MDGGAWLRPQRTGMMVTIRVVHTVVVSAIACDFGACGRRISALAAYGLLRWLGGRRAAGRVRDYGSGSAWFKTWSLRTQHDAHGAVRGFWRIGRCEERGCRADRGLSDVAATGQKEIATFARVPYVCRWSGDVLNASIYLVLS